VASGVGVSAGGGDGVGVVAQASADRNRMIKTMRIMVLPPVSIIAQVGGI
jgi:hypothetical protein